MHAFPVCAALDSYRAMPKLPVQVTESEGIIMEHLQIAYDFVVIIIGFAALAFAITWAAKTGDADLGNFCVLYALFTMLMVLTVLRKYLSLNVAGYSASAWYYLSGLLQATTLGVVVALLNFELGVYRVARRKVVMSVLLLVTVACLILMFSPVGAVLDAPQKSIRYGIGFRIAAVWYLACFTMAIILGYSLLRRLWNTDKRSFMLGLLIFATVGFAESVVSTLQVLRIPGTTLAAGKDFIYSSIPFAVYGIFVIGYFLRSFGPVTEQVRELPEAFVAKYGITAREREIILKVSEGKSNADIARDLVVSIGTVKTHLHNIYAKLGVDSRYSLLARVRSGQ
jgi:DNA-binding CsgD family transcriptional regulator